MSDAGLERIARFSRTTWIAGAVVIMGIAAIVMPRIYQAPDGGIIVEGDEQYRGDVSPWFQDDPAELTIDDGTISGTADGGYVDLEPGAAPFVVSLSDSGGSYITARQSVGEWDPDDYAAVSTLGYLFDHDDIAYVLPGTRGGRLWLDGDEGDWSVDVRMLQPEPLEGSADGSGEALLLYEGDALSARFEHTGSGIFRVTVVAPGEEVRLAVNDVDEVDTRASWQNQGAVLFVIDSPGDGSWSIAVDE